MRKTDDDLLRAAGPPAHEPRVKTYVQRPVLRVGLPQAISISRSQLQRDESIQRLGAS